MRRPPFATGVGVIGVIAGSFPLAEAVAVLVSPRFAAWLLPQVRSILPVPLSVAVVLIVAIAAADLTLGVGVLTGRRWALYGMVLRSVVGVPIDYLNFTAGNPAGAIVGLAVNVFIVWALLRTDSRIWFRAASG